MKLERIANHKHISMGWDIALLFAMVYTLFKVPATMLFTINESYFFLIPDLVISALFFLDRFHLKRMGEEFNSMRPSKTAGVLSCIPFYSIMFAFGISSGWGPILQSSHVLRLNSLVKRFRWYAEQTLIGKGFRAIGIISVSSLVFHWLACGWVYLHPTDKVDQITQYNEALYWAVTTLTTVGYGDVTPTDNVTRVFTMIVMLLGVLFYGLVIGQVSNYMLTADKRKETEHEELEVLSALFKHYEIPDDLKDETFKFYKHHLQQSVIESEARILSALPTALESEIRVHMKVKPLAKVELFLGCSIACLSDAAKALEHEYYSPGDAIIKRGEIGSEMFVIGHGRVIVHSGDTVLVELGDDACFGEMALLQEETRNADITAKSYCDLYKLPKSAFTELIKNHKDLAANALRIVENRLAS
jgi:hypothetical protein